MKRAKIMLSALAVLAVVGSALAFKASRTFDGNLKCTTLTSTQTTNCPLSSYITTDAPDARVMACKPHGAANDAPCTIATVRLEP